MIDLNTDTLGQAEFGELVGISQPAVSGLLNGGVIQPGDGWRVWLLAYCARLRETAAGRMSEEGARLQRERADLARVQRERIELANAVTRSQQAPIDILGDALAKAVQVMVSELEQIDGLLAQTCPDLPEAARAGVLRCVADARNKIATRGATLVMAAIDPGDDIDAVDVEPV